MRSTPWVWCSLLVLATACGGKNSGDDDGPADDVDDDAPPPDARVDGAVDAPPDAATYTVTGALVGLTSGSATVTITTPDVTMSLELTGDGPFSFGTFATGTTYTVSVTAAGGSPANACFVGNKSGTIAMADVTNVRVECAPPDLRITEIASCFYANVSCWLEVHNPTASAIDLAGYTLRTPAANLGTNPPTGVGSQAFPLPALSVPAGGYVIVRGKPTADTYAGPAVATVAVTGPIVPIWSANGYVELVKANRTVDYVTFGNNLLSPTSVGWDGGNVPALITGDTSYGHAKVRTDPATDTNTSADWAPRAFTTPGGPNDITSDADADLDGIPDQAEVPGGTFAGIDLYAMGARTNRRDVFVQVDRMQSSDLGVIPRREALQRIVDVFATHQIAVHFDVGNMFAAGFDPANFNLGGGNLVPFSTQLNIGTTSGAASLYALKATHFDVRLSSVFYYMVFGYQSSPPAAGGRGELFGNDVIITQGNVGFATSPAAQLNYLINTQAEAVMHELGHNLGLAHGGDAEVNFKPNYISVMNYLYAYRGLPTIGNAEGDRYYLNRGGCGVTDPAQLVNNPFGTTHVLDYSSGASAALDEASLQEAAGLRRTGSTTVDFNCNGLTQTNLALDINADGMQTTLTDFNDWANLRSVFARTAQGSARGPAGRLDPLVDDRQPIVLDAGAFLRVAPASPRSSRARGSRSTPASLTR